MKMNVFPVDFVHPKSVALSKNGRKTGNSLAAQQNWMNENSTYSSAQGQGGGFVGNLAFVPPPQPSIGVNLGEFSSVFRVRPADVGDQFSTPRSD